MIQLEELNAGSGKSWMPEQIGDKISGTIVNVKRVQQTDFTTGEPLEWPDGKPRMQTVVELQTDLREGDDDDGVRAVWLKGGRNYEPQTGSGTSGEVALFEAAKEAGAAAIEEGATLSFAYTGDAKPTTRGYRAARLYKAKYEAPKASVATDDLWD